MSKTFLKRYQQDSVSSAVGVFSTCQEQLAVAGQDAAQRKIAIATNGTLLIEAPTGAGKTLIAGTVAEEMSGRDQVVWFWFAPFAGLVEQTRANLRQEFRGLSPRDLASDRFAGQARSGQVYVTTWASVAARNKEARKVRHKSEVAPTVDEFLPALRQRGFKVGVVVDEAHHGFHDQTQAAAFFKEVLQPEYTVLITATPDDTDLRRFEESMGIREVRRISVSRQDAVEAGLIKRAIKSVAYFADPGQEALVDFERTALREGKQVHDKLKAELKRSGFTLTPLMLVQVDSHEKSVERAKERLLEFGFTEDQIAIHTADEPDPDLLAIANNEDKEVLIFKLAVALGFDAPRAFTLVSFRGVRDADFGIQIVGRILRIHRRLQGRKLPEALEYGYVLLADSGAQEGLANAATRINKLQTELAKASPFSATVRLGGQAVVQVTEKGQTVLFGGTGLPQVKATATPFGEEGFAEQFLFSENPHLPAEETGNETGGVTRSAPAVIVPRGFRARRRFPVPKCFKTERLPDEFTDLECAVADKFALSSQQLLDAMREVVVVKKQTLELFSRQQELALVEAELSRAEVGRRAMKVLWRSDVFDARELKQALLARLATEMRACGMRSVAENADELRHALNLLLAQNPRLLAEAQKAALAEFTRVEDAEKLPEEIVSPMELEQSLKNLYGVIPSGLNRWERNFAQMLDNDLSGIVQWWHRNERQQDWSINVIRPDGKGYYPDFVVAVKGRRKEDSIALVETKAQIEDTEAEMKVAAEHRCYGRPLMLHWDHEERWMTVRFDPAKGKPAPDRVFDISLLPSV